MIDILHHYLNLVSLSYSLIFRYDNTTQGTDFTIDFNATQVPLHINGSYFNNTDAVTLNRHVGVRLGVAYGTFWASHITYYNNTYEQWSLTSSTDYAPNENIQLDLAVRYEPRQFLFSYSDSASYKFSIALAPTPPLMGFKIDFMHPSGVDIKSSASLDLANMTFKGVAQAVPFGEDISLDVVLKPAEKVGEVRTFVYC